MSFEDGTYPSWLDAKLPTDECVRVAVCVQELDSFDVEACKFAVAWPAVAALFAFDC